jgi:alanyl-tRNA synthetase
VLSSDHEQLKCNELIKEINQICQGSGGGNNKFAQGGSNHISTIDALLKYLKK